MQRRLTSAFADPIGKDSVHSYCTLPVAEDRVLPAAMNPIEKDVLDMHSVHLVDHH